MYIRLLDPSMQFRVHPLRYRGRRRRWRDVTNSEPFVGVLLTHVQSSKAGVPVRVATLKNPLASAGDALLPPLYEPVQVPVGPTSLRMRGIEHANGTAILQEWFCEEDEPTTSPAP